MSYTLPMLATKRMLALRLTPPLRKFKPWRGCLHLRISIIFGKKQPVFYLRQKQKTRNATPVAIKDTERIHRSAQPETNLVMAVAKEAIFRSNAAISKRRGRVQEDRPPVVIVSAKEEDKRKLSRKRR